MKNLFSLITFLLFLSTSLFAQEEAAYEFKVTVVGNVNS
jgi:hypothetical protein